MTPVYSGELESDPDNQGLDSFGPSTLGERVSAIAKDTFAPDHFMAGQPGRRALGQALSGDPLLARMDVGPDGDISDLLEAPPTMPIADAQAKVKAAGLEHIITNLPKSDTITASALQIMMDRAHNQAASDEIRAHGPGGFIAGALDSGTSVLMGAVDPGNLFLGMIPVVGEVRFGKMAFEAAGQSLLGRTAVRTGIGAARGAQFGAAAVPLEYLAKTQEGQDYTAVDALHTMIESAGQFAFQHAAGGLIADVWHAARGEPLTIPKHYQGEPTAVPVTPGGVSRETLPGHAGPVVQTYDVRSGAVASKDNPGVTYIDPHIPQFSPILKDKDGNPADLHKYLTIHEQTERPAMEAGDTYKDAHANLATPAERAAVEADGVDWKRYTEEIDGYLSKIEHEGVKNPPPDPHIDPDAADDHHKSENKAAVPGSEPRRTVRPGEPAGAAGPPAASAEPLSAMMLRYDGKEYTANPGETFADFSKRVTGNIGAREQLAAGINTPEVGHAGPNGEFLPGSPERAAAAAVPPAAPAEPEAGMTRLYRVEPLEQKVAKVSDWVKESPEYKAMISATGRWFSADSENVKWYMDHLRADGIEPNVTYLDVPSGFAETWRVSNLPENHPARQFSRRPDEEFFLPAELAALRGDLPDPAGALIGELPERAREDVLRGAIVNLANGETVRTDELLKAAAKADPKIAAVIDPDRPVFHDVVRQLTAIGAPDQEARYQAGVIEAYYRARAERLNDGRSALDIYQQELEAIRAGEAQAPPGRAFGQPRPSGPDLFAERPVLDEAAQRQEEFRAMMARYEAEREGLKARITQAMEAKGRFEVVPNYSTDENPKTWLLTRNPEAEAGRPPYRITFFADKEPTGHIEVRDLDEAAREMTSVSRRPDYQEARAAHNKAQAEYAVARDAYRAQKIGDQEFLAARAKYDEATKKFDAAFAAEEASGKEARASIAEAKKAKPVEPGLFAEREAEGQAVLPGGERITDSELAQRRAAQGLKAKVAQKPMDVGLFSDEADQKSFFQTPQPRPVPQAPPFYSAVARAVENAKQEKASPEQWLATIKNTSGVKQEEMEWLGLPDWLKEQEGSVTKQEIGDYVRANAIEVKDVRKGAAGNAAEMARLEAEQAQAGEEAHEISERFIDALQRSGLKPEGYPLRGNITEWEQPARQAELEKAGLKPLYDEREAAWDRWTKIGEQLRDQQIPKSRSDTRPDAQATAEHGEEWKRLTDEINVLRAELNKARAEMSTAYAGIMHKVALLEGDRDALHNEMVDETWERLNAKGLVSGEAKWGPPNYSGQGAPLPGGENYREMLLTLPNDTARAVETVTTLNRVTTDLARLRAQEKGQQLLGRVDPGMTGRIDDLVKAQERLRGELASRSNIPPPPVPVTTLPEGYHSIVDTHAPAPYSWGVIPPGQVHAGSFVGMHATEEDAIAAAISRINSDAIYEHEQQVRQAAERSTFKTGHWDEPNVIAHIRFDDRVIDGKRALHVAEIQSDWHQQGRKKGYQFDVEKRLDELTKEWGDPATSEARKIDITTEMNRLHDNNRYGVPDAPFKTTWAALSLKRMIRYAAENGYDMLSWDTGETNAERYNLANVIKHMEVERQPGRNGGNVFRIIATNVNGLKHNLSASSENDLADLIGKEMAQKIVDSYKDAPVKPKFTLEQFTNRNGGKDWHVYADGKFSHDQGGENETAALERAERLWEAKHTRREFSGLDLKVGGEGMKGHYDKILPAEANKIVKKFGAKVETAKLPKAREDDYLIEGEGGDDGGYFLYGHITDEGQHTEWFATLAEAESARNRLMEDDRLQGVIEVPGEYHNWRYEGPQLTHEQILEARHGRRLTAAIDRQLQDIADAVQYGMPMDKAVELHGSHATAEILGGKFVVKPRTIPVHSIEITPQLREAAVGQGFPLFQAGEGAPRGRVTFQNNRAVIELFKSADRSTFLHESGHLFLENLIRDAGDENAPQSFKDDLKTVMDWLGVSRPEDIGTEQHEQWARGFEQYLMEGKAPSSALAEAFEHFKRWLTEIYKSLANLGAPLSADVRAVMDRMLATDGEIAAYRQQQLGQVAPADWHAVAEVHSPAMEPESIAAEKEAAEMPMPASAVPDEEPPVRVVRSLKAARKAMEKGEAVNVVIAKRKPGGPRSKPEETWSILQFLAGKGGLKPSPELDVIFGGVNPFIPGFGKLIRKGGMGLDVAREAAVHNDYLIERGDISGGVAQTTERDLLHLVDEENRGRKQYRVGKAPAEGEEDPDVRAHQMESAFDVALKEAEIDPASISEKVRARALEIMDKEHQNDPTEAYLQAVMEHDEHGAEIGEHEPRSEPIPEWNVPDEPAAMPGAGGGAAAARQGEPGAGLRERSEADREGREAQGGGKPSPRLAAAQAAADEAQAQWDNIVPTLSEEERVMFEDAFAKVEQDSADRSEIVRQGAACLAASVNE